MQKDGLFDCDRALPGSADAQKQASLDAKDITKWLFTYIPLLGNITKIGANRSNNQHTVKPLNLHEVAISLSQPEPETFSPLMKQRAVNDCFLRNRYGRKRLQKAILYVNALRNKFLSGACRRSGGRMEHPGHSTKPKQHAALTQLVE